MRLLLVRHGQTAANVRGELDTAPPGPGLTRLGRRQAKAIPGELAAESIDGIYSSALIRTQETAHRSRGGSRAAGGRPGRPSRDRGRRTGTSLRLALGSALPRGHLRLGRRRARRRHARRHRRARVLRTARRRLRRHRRRARRRRDGGRGEPQRGHPGVDGGPRAQHRADLRRSCPTRECRDRRGERVADRRLGPRELGRLAPRRNVASGRVTAEFRKCPHSGTFDTPGEQHKLATIH